MIDTILSPIIWATSFVMMLWHRAFGAIFGSDSSASWVLAIIFLTITIRAAMIPLFRKQIKSMQNMQRLQPQIQALQKKYKLDKQKLQQEMMKLYKDNGTSPFASCMPILLQTPFFMGLYRVLSHVSAGNAVGALSKTDSVSAMHASFFGAPLSLSFLHHTPAQMARLHITSVTNLQVIAIIMAVIYATSQFLTQRMMMAKNTNLDNTVPNPMMQSQKIMLYVMPFGMLFFSLNVQIGVVLYLMTTNVWTIGQQFYTLRNSPMPGSQAEKDMIARRKAKEERKRQELIAKDPEAAKELAAANGSATQDKVAVSRQRQQPVRTTRSKRKK